MADEKITEEQLRKLREAIPEVRAEVRATFEDLAAEPVGRLREKLGADFTWAQYYELSAGQAFVLFLASVGALGFVEAAARSQPLPLHAVIEALQEFDPDTSIEGGWKGGDGGLFQQRDVAALAVVMGKQMECLETFGRYLTDLVDDVRHGVEESFFKAVRIDRTVLGTEPFVVYMSLQELNVNDAFFAALGNALRGRWKKSMAAHADLRVLLQATHEGGLWERLSRQAEAERVFIRELKAYTDRGADPVRGLQRFMARWKANKIND